MRSDHDMLATCLSCGWKHYQSVLAPQPFCGPCSRELGIEARTAETDAIDQRVKQYQEQEKHRIREGGING